MADRLEVVAVGVSGAGSNLKALVAAERRGELGGRIGLVFADRPCAALDWATAEGIPTALVPGGDDQALAASLAAAAPDAVVLAGYMRIVGPVVAGSLCRTHPQRPPLAPASVPRCPRHRRCPGSRRGRDRLHGPRRRRRAGWRSDRPAGAGAGPGHGRRRRPAGADPVRRTPPPAARRGAPAGGRRSRSRPAALGSTTRSPPSGSPCRGGRCCPSPTRPA